MSPRISVLIPSYNHELYIGQTIQSITKQTYSDLEIIIIDDGSTDNSWDIIKQHAACDHRIKAFKQNNQGLICTLNSLFTKSTGEFIAQIDSDDMWFPKRLEWGVEDMEQDSSLSASFCSFVRINGDNDLTGHIKQFEMGEIRGRDLMNFEAVSNWLCACTGFMRRSSLLKAGGFARPFTLAHDWDRWLRLSLHGNLKYRPDIGALYRVHDKNQSHDHATCHRQCIKISSELTPQVIDHYRLGDEATYRYLTRLTNLALELGDYQTASAKLREKGRRFSLSECEMINLLQCLTLGDDKSVALELADAMSQKEETFSIEGQRRLRSVRQALDVLTAC